MFQFDLSLAELRLVGLAMKLDVEQYPFSLPYAGATQEERLPALYALNDMLHTREYARGDDFVPELWDALTVFATGQPSIVVMGDGPKAPIVARAARTRRRSVLAKQQGDRMNFVLGDDAGLVPSVLGLLPEHGRGKGHSTTIAMSGPEQRPADDDDVDFSTINFLDGSRSGDRGYQQRQQADLSRLLDGDRLGGGSVRIEHAGDRDTRSRRFLLRWIDTSTGRYAGYTTYGPDGRELMTFTPADRNFLGRTIDGFLHQVGG